MAKVNLTSNILEPTCIGSKETGSVPITRLNSCSCCGAWNVGLIKMNNCTHTGFLRLYFKRRINITMSLMCHYCHYMLKKIDKFKKQIEKYIKSQKMCPNPTLSLVLPLIVDIDPEQLNTEEIASNDTLTESEINEQEVKEETDVEERTETQEANVKFEFDTDEIDIGETVIETPSKQPEIQKVFLREDQPLDEPQIPSLPEKIENSPKRSDNIDDLLKGKVMTLYQSIEELEEEREAERSSENYLKRPYRCEDCIVSFLHQDNLTTHLQKHDKLKNPRTSRSKRELREVRVREREANRLYQKERYKRIKSNPELYEIQKEKDRRKYEEQKRRKIKKSIAQLTRREQNVQRAKWRANTKKYLEKKRKSRKTQDVDGLNELFEDDLTELVDPLSSQSTQLKNNRKRYRK